MTTETESTTSLVFAGAARDAALVLLATPALTEHPAIGIQDRVDGESLMVLLVDGWRWSSGEHVLVDALAQVAAGGVPNVDVRRLDAEHEAAVYEAARIIAGARVITGARIMSPPQPTIAPGMVVTAKRTVQTRAGAVVTAALGLVTGVHPSPDGIAPTVVLRNLDTRELQTFRAAECTPVTDAERLRPLALSGNDVADVEVGAAYDPDAETVVLTIGHVQVSIVGVDPHDEHIVLNTADLLDNLTDVLAETARDLRRHLADLCETCHGYGVVGLDERDEKPCPRCGGFGSI